ncbi:MAG: type II toxin-antitoxin system VapC family toxin [Rhizobiaceae bacterium]
MTKLMLDTNVINRIQSGDVELSTFDGHELCITHIQRDELNRTTDRNLAEAFLKILSVIEPKIIPTNSGIWGDSRWGQFRWSKGETYTIMLDRLKVLDSEKKKKSNQPLNQSRDARIAETAIANNCTLISTDSALLILTKEFHGNAVHLDDFLLNINA